MSAATLNASQDSVASSAASSSGGGSSTDGLPMPARRVSTIDSSSSSSYSPSNPHDPNLKPAASILANAHEGTSREKVRAKSSKRSAFKAAFVPVQPGRLIKSNGKPLGKSFERKTPLPQGAKFEGGVVLQHDPRGEEASSGDGLVPAGATSSDTTGSSSVNGASSGEVTGDSLSESGSTTGLSSSPSTSMSSYSRSPSVDTAAGGEEDDVFSEVSSPIHHPRSRTETMSTESSSVSAAPLWDMKQQKGELADTNYATSLPLQSGSSQCAIRFAPLPVSGRLKRANSITIGVAARSQLLRSQGTGRNSSQFPAQPIQAPLPHGMSYQDTHKGVQAGSPNYNPRNSKQNVQRSGSQNSGTPGSVGSSGSRRSGEPQVGSPSSQSSSSINSMSGFGALPDDTVDLGEELSKGLKSAWRKMRGGSTSNGSDKNANGEKTAVGAPADKVTPSTVSATKKTSGFDAPSNTADKSRTGSAVAADPGGGAANKGASSGGTATPAAGDHTPRRPTSPAQGLSALSLQDRQQQQAQDSSQGSHHDHFPAHGSANTHKGHSHGPGPWQHHNPFLVDHEDRGGDGAKTPRASQQNADAGSSGMTGGGPHRRLSTGAFLKNESLREMQERRRKGLLGMEGESPDEHDDEHDEDGFEEAEQGAMDQAREQETFAASLKQSLGRTGAGTVLARLSPWGGQAPASTDDQDVGRGLQRQDDVVMPKHNPEQEDDSSSSGRNDDDEGDEDEEEMREAEQLAEQSAAAASRGRMEKAAAVEKVH